MEHGFPDGAEFSGEAERIHGEKDVADMAGVDDKEDGVPDWDIRMADYRPTPSCQKQRSHGNG